MAERLSEQLADLSVHAKNAEDAFAAAQKEAHDKVVARREQAHAAATAAMEKVNQDKSAKDTTTRNWNALQAKIAADMQVLKTGIVQRKQSDRPGALKTLPRDLSGRRGSRSIMPSHRLSRRIWPFSMLSRAALRPRRSGEPYSQCLAATTQH